MIEERLESEGQRQAAEWVRGLPEDTPGMAWRAALNDRVRAEAERKARNRWRWSLARPVLGVAMAATLALVMVVPRAGSVLPVASTARPAGRLEAGLVALHDESVRDADIAGTGLRPAEAPVTLPSGADPIDDLDAGVM